MEIILTKWEIEQLIWAIDKANGFSVMTGAQRKELMALKDKLNGKKPSLYLGHIMPHLMKSDGTLVRTPGCLACQQKESKDG